MSKEIKMDGPLSKEDRQYLADRGQTAVISMLDERYGVEPDSEVNMDGDGTGPRAVPLGTAELRAERRAELQRQLKELEQMDAVEEAESDEDDAPEDGEELRPYEEWKVPQLKAELKARGLPQTGTQPDLAARLRTDDDSRTE